MGFWSVYEVQPRGKLQAEYVINVGNQELLRINNAEIEGVDL